MTELQHEIEPVLHWLTSVTVDAGAVAVTVTVGAPQGVATARRESESAMRKAA